MRYFVLLLFVVACGSIGFETGWLTGNSGPDASVLAAVLPVILGTFMSSIGLLIVKAMSQDSEKKTEAAEATQTLTLWPVILSAIVFAAILFTFMMHVGTGLGVAELQNRNKTIRENTLNERTAQRKAEKIVAEERMEAVYVYVEACTNVWNDINRVRTAAKLETLTIAQSCVALPSVDAGKLADVFVRDAVDVLLSKEALNKHKELLQHCTSLQIKIKNAGPEDRAPTIGDVCPLFKQG